MRKRLFTNNKKFIYIFFLIPILIFLIFILFFYNLNKKFFDIPIYSSSYYFYPEDLGGLKINNLDKKSLHMNISNKNSEIINDYNLKYSIQVFSSSDYIVVTDKLNEFKSFNCNKKDDYFFEINEFYLALFNNNISDEYFLLYKNFDNRQSALNYCTNLLKCMNNCLVVNVQNF